MNLHQLIARKIELEAKLHNAVRHQNRTQSEYLVYEILKIEAKITKKVTANLSIQTTMITIKLASDFDSNQDTAKVWLFSNVANEGQTFPMIPIFFTSDKTRTWLWEEHNAPSLTDSEIESLDMLARNKKLAFRTIQSLAKTAMSENVVLLVNDERALPIAEVLVKYCNYLATQKPKEPEVEIPDDSESAFISAKPFSLVSSLSRKQTETTGLVATLERPKTEFDLANYLQRPDPLEGIPTKEFNPDTPVKVGDKVIDTNGNQEGVVELVDTHADGSIDTVWVHLKNHHHKGGVGLTFMYSVNGNYKLGDLTYQDGNPIKWA